MVKRAKLTLNHPEVEEQVAAASEAESSASGTIEQADTPDSSNHYGKMLLLAGITIVSLIVFRQKLF
jgi:hypothetical protein